MQDPSLALPMLPPLQALAHVLSNFMQASVLWTDAFNSASATATLSDLEWFMLLRPLASCAPEPGGM